MSVNTAQIEHLKLIQGVINRMAQVSFILKGWAVTLVIAILGFATSSSDAWIALLAIFPSLVFWGLDTYYLRQERLFRELYSKILNPNGQLIPAFSMDTTVCNEDIISWRRTFISRTIISLHGIIMILIITVSIVLFL